MTSRGWHSVPDAARDGWGRAFAAPSRGADLDGPCPVCGERQLHRYFQVGARPAGLGAPAGGALWEWCSHCRSYEHATALVPAWWRSDLAVDERALTAVPDALEAALARRTMTDLDTALGSTDVEAVYDAIVGAGQQQRRDLAPQIEAFLESADASLREAALKTVGFYWGLAAHRARPGGAARRPGPGCARGGRHGVEHDSDGGRG